MQELQSTARHSEGIKTATDTLVKRIRELILTYELPPGTRLKNNELAERFGMSITPVREALGRLEKMGLVAYQARRGWEVKTTDNADLKEVYDMREYLERLAVKTICERRIPVNTLQDRLEEYEQILASGDLEHCVESDLAFHSELIRLAGNKYAISMMNQLLDIIYIGRSLENYEENNQSSVNEHKAILEAIKSGDSHMAETRVSEHLRDCVSWA